MANPFDMTVPSGFDEAVSGGLSAFEAVKNIQNQRRSRELQQQRQQQLLQIQQQQSQQSAALLPLKEQLLKAQAFSAAQPKVRNDLLSQVQNIKDAVNKGQLSRDAGATLLSAIIQGKKGTQVNIGGTQIPGIGGLSTTPQQAGTTFLGAQGGIAPGIAGQGGAPSAVSPSTVLPNTGQTSRGTQGATKLDINGNLVTIPTRQTQGFLQQRLAGEKTVEKPLDDYTKAMAPYAGIEGKGRLLKDFAKLAMGDKSAEARIGAYKRAVGMTEGISEESARTAIGATPSETSINGWKKAINPGVFTTPELFTQQMQGVKDFLKNTAGSSSKDFREGGINVGTLSPAARQSLEVAQQNAANQPNIKDIFLPHEHVMIHGDAVSEGKVDIAPTVSDKHLSQAANPQKEANFVTEDQVKSLATESGQPEDEIRKELSKKGIEVR